MLTVFDDIGTVAGYENSLGILPAATPSGTVLAKWISKGVPGLQGIENGDEIVDSPVLVLPSDKFFGLALLDHFERIGWRVETEPTVSNVFCPTGPGGGVDATCSPGGEPKLPEEPTFISSNPALTQPNLQAVAELKELAKAGDIEGLLSHPGTPSPKVQTYKDKLVQFVAKGKLEKYNDKSGDVPSTGTAALPNPSTLKYVKDLPGSTHPKLVEDTNGKQYVMKAGVGKADQLRNEEDANNAYRALGIAVPKSGIVETATGAVKLSEFMKDATTLSQWQKTASGNEVIAMNKEIAKGFVADSLLANHDVIGLTKDNIMIKDGKPYRIDNGGALKYRAQGQPKGEAFGSTVKELNTLKDASLNPSAAGVFQHLTDKEINSQIQNVLSKKSDVLNSVKDLSTRAILEKRFESLEAKLLQAPTPVSSPVVPSPFKPATAPAYASKPESTSNNPLHTGEGLAKHLNKQLEGKEKMTAMQIKKFAVLNPDGMKSPEVLVPMPYAFAGGAKSQAKQIEVLGKILPAGTAIKSQNQALTAEKLGITKTFGGGKKETEKEIGTAQGTFTTEKATQATGDIHTQTSSHFPEIKSDSSVVLPSKSYDQEKHDAWRKTLTPSEQNAISTWKGTAKNIRAEVASGNMGTTTKNFLSAITKAAPHEGVTYRGISGKYSEEMAAQIEAAGVGGHWIDASPHCMSISPSTSSYFSHGQVLFRIASKTGRPIAEEDGHTSEKEVVGMANTKYQITGIYKNVTVSSKAAFSNPTTIKHVIDLKEV